MSFTVAPESLEEEVAAWSCLSKGSSESIPSAVVLWRWYDSREKINLGEQHKLTIFRFSLWSTTPAFYWIQGLKLAQVREALLEAVRIRPINSEVTEMLKVASFLGRGVYTKVLSMLGDYRNRISPAMNAYPKTGLKATFPTLQKSKHEKEAVFREKKLKELNTIASEVENTGKAPGVMKRSRAIKIDCYLYSQDNQYK